MSPRTLTRTFPRTPTPCPVAPSPVTPCPVPPLPVVPPCPVPPCAARPCPAALSFASGAGGGHGLRAGC